LCYNVIDVKTQIIQLEPYDDIYSVKDKIGWNQAPRILLIQPAREQILTRQLDLTLLKRHCTELGAQLAFVARGQDFRVRAEQLGIPVYTSRREAEQSHWRVKKRRQRRTGNNLGEPLSAAKTRQLSQKASQHPTAWELETLRRSAHPEKPTWFVHPTARLIAFTLGVLSVLAIAAVLLPSARLHLKPETRTETVTVSVMASPEHDDVDISGAVPAPWKAITVEGGKSITTTGSISLPDESASGRVTFTNLTNEEITLPRGSIVTTLDEQPIRFATNTSATIPPNASITIAIQAIEPGVEGNVPAESIVAIEGPIGLNLSVTNKEATSGGTRRLVPAPNVGDYERLYKDLYETLSASALEEIQATLDPSDLLISEEAHLVEVLEERYTPAEPAPADQLSLTLRVAFRALTVDERSLYELGRAALETNLPPGFDADTDSLVIENLSGPRLNEEENIARWQLQARWEITAQLDPVEATNLALGLPREQAAERLNEDLPLEEPATVSLIPPFWPRLPTLPFRISVTTESP
jgi:hypothetical protein